MRLVHEVVIMVMETLAMLLISAGLGVIAAWFIGVAGLLLASGVCLLIFAMLIAMRQKSMSAAPPKSATNDAGRR
ncbi:MAG: hypothetical protein ACRDTZ_00955 [Pseudonocardiaceae bacterium]